MKLSRTFAPLVALLSFAASAFAQSNPGQGEPSNIVTNIAVSGQILTAGETAVVIPAAVGPITLTLPLQPAGSSVIQVKNESPQQVTINGNIFATTPVTSVYLNPGEFASFMSDGTYEFTSLYQNLFDTYTQVLNGAYTLTTSLAAVVGGTTSPTIQIRQGDAGWYYVVATGNLYLNGATFAAAQNVIVNIQRTNNTVGAIPGTGITMNLGIITTTTQSEIFTTPPQLVYLNNLDILTLYASIGATPSAGSAVISNASILAFKWH